MIGTNYNDEKYLTYCIAHLKEALRIYRTKKRDSVRLKAIHDILHDKYISYNDAIPDDEVMFVLESYLEIFQERKKYILQLEYRKKLPIYTKTTI